MKAKNNILLDNSFLKKRKTFFGFINYFKSHKLTLKEKTIFILVL
jgi:hypothetical protein